MVSCNFRNPVFVLISSSLTLSFHMMAVYVGTCDKVDELLPVFFICVTGSGHNSAPYSNVDMTSDSYTTCRLLADWCSYFSRCFLIFQRHLMLCQFSSCTLCHSFLISTRCCAGSRSHQLIRLRCLRLLLPYRLPKHC